MIVHVLLIISYILDGILSLVFKTNSIFLPLCTLTTIILIYPLFKRDMVKYFIIIGVTGVLYDIGYGDLYMLNVILFLSMGLLTMFMDYYLPNNYLTGVLEVIISIIIYRLLGYLLSLIFIHNGFNIWLLFKSIYSSLIVNMIYGLVIYFIVDKNIVKYEISSKK